MLLTKCRMFNLAKLFLDVKYLHRLATPANKPVGWNRKEIMFVTGHGNFPSYLHRFNLRIHDDFSCGEKGDPMHYATKCRFTLSWNFQTPTVSLKLQWLNNILSNNLSRTRLRLRMRFICDENNLIVEDNH
ncbi:hypothetical protein AVEN_79546-1 [Araneus ventricosus]|uniref:Uncharacterized protein n=1 Tax=Araneus ventricosus TaxID=182803 RepID=A0A4Y2KR00_ARAVE|nr:hypothetical protein AVEN_79546-1 [Araneus ventricosus]